MIRAWISDKPWLWFLVLGVLAQQANIVTYKFGAENTAQPYIFIAYSFLFQACINFILMLFFKNRGFPLVIKTRMRFFAIWVMAIYFLNEVMFVQSFASGAPVTLMVVIFSVLSLCILSAIGILLFREGITWHKFIGIVAALCAIALIKLG